MRRITIWIATTAAALALVLANQLNINASPAGDTQPQAPSAAATADSASRQDSAPPHVAPVEADGPLGEDGTPHRRHRRDQ